MAQIRRAKKRARPLRIAQVCEHAERSWFGSGRKIDYRDVLLHAIIVVGLNLGLRYDEADKMRIENVSSNPRPVRYWKHTAKYSYDYQERNKG